MSKTLLIIESPGKKKTLESILGPDYLVRASFGHVRDLPIREIGVTAPDFRPQYVTTDRAASTIENLRLAAAGADRVVLATDPDREGEAIAWHISEALKLKNPQRVTYGEITPKAVIAALMAPRPIDMHLVHAQEARRVLDRLVGYQVSPALSERAGQTLSAGRVQSPAVRLVVERERAIRDFAATKHYGAILTFPTPAPWRAAWKPDLPAGVEFQLDAALAKVAAGVKHVRVVGFEDGTSTSSPPAPFTTSTLQQAAQSKLKFKPTKTMELAQRLFESGLNGQGAITYMRTDSPNISDDAYAEIATYAQARGLQLADGKRTWKAKGNAQEAHEAIRPTHFEVLDAGNTDEEKALYRLIWSRAVASQLADATFATRTAKLKSLHEVGATETSYEARGSTLTNKGWKVLYDEREDDDDKEQGDEDAINSVPVLEVGAVLVVGNGKVQAKTTKAPKRFTLATLVKELEANGIGRPSTYAAILENITRREYIAEDKKGFLTATPIAEKIVDALVGSFAFVGLEYTRELEHDLDRVAEGAKAYVAVVAAAHAQLTGEIGKLGTIAVHACPECGKAMRRRTAAKGAFWGCTGFPNCKTTLPDVDGSPGSRQPLSARNQTSVQSCVQCASPLRRVKKSKESDPRGRGFDFFACLGCSFVYRTAADGTADLTSGQLKRSAQ